MDYIIQCRRLHSSWRLNVKKICFVPEWHSLCAVFPNVVLVFLGGFGIASEEDLYLRVVELGLRMDISGDALGQRSLMGLTATVAWVHSQYHRSLRGHRTYSGTSTVVCGTTIE